MQSIESREQLKLTSEGIQRFWGYVDKNGASPTARPDLGNCWTWTAFVNGNGYATFRFAGRAYRAHRFAYLISRGDIPPGHYIDHLCFVRSCVNPDHLDTVTNRQNQENRLGATALNRSSGVRGVTWHKEQNKWQAQVWSKQKNYYAGLFVNLEDAESAAIALRMKLHSHNRLDRAAS